MKTYKEIKHLVKKVYGTSAEKLTELSKDTITISSVIVGNPKVAIYYRNAQFGKKSAITHKDVFHTAQKVMKLAAENNLTESNPVIKKDGMVWGCACVSSIWQDENLTPLFES